MQLEFGSPSDFLKVRAKLHQFCSAIAFGPLFVRFNDDVDRKVYRLWIIHGPCA